MEEHRQLQSDDTTAAIFEREAEPTLATVATRFGECAKNFGAAIGPNGWARSGDVPAEALAGCLDPIIVRLAARRISSHRIFNELQDAIERTRPPACFPFMPCELFETSSPVRSVILVRIRQATGQSQPSLATAIETSRKSPSQRLIEYKILKKIRTHELVADDLGLERSVYFDLKRGRKVSDETYTRAALKLDCRPEDLKR